MSDMHIRNKLRNISEAAQNGEHIPERSKKVGMFIFYFFIAMGMLGLLALLISFLFYGHWIGASISSVAIVFLFYIIYKLVSAENINL